jgi:hypothetical protein
MAAPRYDRSQTADSARVSVEILLLVNNGKHHHHARSCSLDKTPAMDEHLARVVIRQLRHDPASFGCSAGAAAISSIRSTTAAA